MSRTLRSGRQSLGGNILREANANRLASLRSSSPGPGPSVSKRRVSFGGDLTSMQNNDVDDSNDAKKDRRSKLEEWRAQVRARESGNGDSNDGGKENQNQNQHSAIPSLSLPTPPPAIVRDTGGATPGGIEVTGTTAVERFRMRRKQREQMQLQMQSGGGTAAGTGTGVSAAVEASSDFSKPVLPPAFPISSDRSTATTSTAAVSEDMSSTSAVNMAASAPSSICFDEDPTGTGLGATTSSSSYGVGRRSISTLGRNGLTPTRNRRMTMGGGARRRTTVTSRSRKSMTPSRAGLGLGLGASLGAESSNDVDTSADNNDDNTTTTTRSVDSSAAVNLAADLNMDDNNSNPSLLSSSDHHHRHNETTTSDPDALGLKSRMVNMEKRIRELEKEKMALSMSKAPLEARLRQKEDEWRKDMAKYDTEINALMSNSREDTERLKRMENELEEMQIENNRLVFEMRKQKSAAATDDILSGSGVGGGAGGDASVWGRQLQNDRDVAELKDKLRTAQEEIKSLRLEKVSIESEVNATNMELSSLLRDFDSLQMDYEQMREEQNSNGEAEIQLEELSKEHTATLALLNATSGELASLRSQSKFQLEQKEKQWNEEKEQMLFQMSVLKSRAATIDTSDEESTSSEDEAVLKARIEERDRRIEQLEAEVLEGEQVRRAMHNKIQELRGNIRVFVRTRPFLPGDGSDSASSSSLDIHPDGENLSIESKSKPHNFKFDKIFPPSSAQDAVFDEVSEFVQSALDGYHVCLFSYGQTGSGKTHTMQGSGSGAMRGIIPRAVEQILDQANRMQKQNWKFTIMASFLEIYNEELKDLLVNMNGGTVTTSGVATRNQSQSNKLSIRRERSGKSYVAGLKKVKIDTENSEEGMQCLKNLMASAARSRSVASTQMNAVSSRSHSVFMLHLTGKNEDGTTVEGALNLCDLAGSERLDRSGAGSDAKRLKETQAINKSLSCLGDVFTSLSNGSSHVPFRNSKLTYLLQDCLSGDGKALMFVNLSPTVQSSSESLCSLRFAQRVNQVELGKATKNISYNKHSS